MASKTDESFTTTWASELLTGLGATLVAAMTGAGVADADRIVAWANDERVSTQDEAQRLDLGYYVWNLIRKDEGENVARQWFIGGNPLLGERTPITAIREYDKDAVVNAALAFLRGEQDV